MPVTALSARPTGRTAATADYTCALLDGPWRHEFVSSGGSRFHVALAGPESRLAPLVVLLHGYPQFWWAWRAQIPVLAGSDSAAESHAAGGEAHASRPSTDIERAVTGTVVTPTEPMTRAQQHGQTVVDVHRPGAVPGETPIVTVTVQHPDDQEPARSLPAASPVQTRRSRNQH